MTDQLPLGLLFALLFNLMGPVTVMARFASATGGLDTAGRRRTALVAAAISLVALAIAIALGSLMLTRFQIDRASMIVAAGIVLLAASLRNIYPPAAPTKPASPGASIVSLAISPVSVPGIVTPAAVGLLVVFASYFPAMEARLMIFVTVAVIMVMNLAAMIYAHALLAIVGDAPLVVLGAVFGILQVALAIEMIFSGVKLSFS